MLLISLVTASPLLTLPERDPSIVQVSSKYTQLTRRILPARSANGSVASVRQPRPANARLPYHSYSQVFNVKVTIQGKVYELILNTASSDTWIVNKDFACFNGSSQQVPESYCAFGPTFSGSYPRGRFSNANFNVTYSNTASFVGDLGALDIALAGLRVISQTVALSNRVQEPTVVLDNVTSGLMGMAYSTLTHGFVGDDPTLDDIQINGAAPGNQLPYSPIMQTMIAQGLTPPLFSLALQRAENVNQAVSPGGYLAFGGLPPLAFDPVFTTVPIQIYNWNSSGLKYPSAASTNYTFYTIVPNGYTITNKAGKRVFHINRHPAIIDSSTLQMGLPQAIYNAYLKSISPQPLDSPSPLYGPAVPCNSTVPDLGVKIGGTVFNISGKDLLLPYLNTTVNGTDYCSVAVTNAAYTLPGGGTTEVVVIAATFLQNVVAVFDYGNHLMRFAPHYY